MVCFGSQWGGRGRSVFVFDSRVCAFGPGGSRARSAAQVVGKRQHNQLATSDDYEEPFWSGVVGLR